MRSFLMLRTVSLTLALALVSTVTAHAQTGATDIVKDRTDLMKALGQNAKTIDLMMAGKAGYDAKRFKSAVGAIKTRSGDAITRLFPEGSNHEPTRAKASIWKDWAAFKKEADRLTTYADALDWIASNYGQAISTPGRGSAVGAGPPVQADGFPAPEHVRHLPPHTIFGYVKKICLTCHDAFRKPKE